MSIWATKTLNIYYFYDLEEGEKKNPPTQKLVSTQIHIFKENRKKT